MHITNRERDAIVTMFRAIRLKKRWSIRKASEYLEIDWALLFRIENKIQKPSKIALLKMTYLVHKESI